MERKQVKMSRVVAFATGALCSMLLHAQVTDLTASKSGADIVFTWNSGTANFNVSLSNYDSRFPFPTVLSADLSTGSYIYASGLTNGVNLQFFDISDANDPGSAGNYTGGAVPPPLPAVLSVSPTSGLKVGDPLTIGGSGFSPILKENVVHFPEGITATPSSASVSSL